MTGLRLAIDTHELSGGRCFYFFSLFDEVAMIGIASEPEFRNALDRLCVGDIEEWLGEPITDLTAAALAGLVRTALYSQRSMADSAMDELERWGYTCNRVRRAVGCPTAKVPLEVYPTPNDSF
ncbi:hypothetical protein WCLP8_700005 [uncultured Gammaproteobacteria bacterium]